MNKLCVFACAIAIVTLLGLGGNRWIGATQTHEPEGSITTRVLSRPVGTPSPPGWELEPADHPSVSHRVNLNVSAVVLPGRRVKVSAHSDILSRPHAEDHLYEWKLDFVRQVPGQQSEIVWAWTYENSQVAVQPGTQITPEFTDTVILPAGGYLARVSLLRMTWEDGVDGWQLVPVKDDYRLTSTRVVVE